MKIRNTFVCLSLLLASPAWAADVPVPVATDSRIKTFVYSENDVYNIVTHYGYQSNVEFSRMEEIETISIGDRVGWQIVPAGRRLFIRAMSVNARTNMTVVTNKRAYQFDLASVPTPVAPNEELAYVVRFFYPDDKKNALPPAAIPYSDDMRAPAFRSESPAPSAPSAPPVSSEPTGGQVYNYNYTYTGDDAMAPIKLFDDGKSTYFKFRSANATPSIAVVTSGKESPLSPRHVGDLWVVDTVASQFTVRAGGATVCVYNEKSSRS